ncbi:MAG: primosomal protein N' [Bacilli bacterium]|nr:primosomal protein N' [Bacilli bacterium]
MVIGVLVEITNKNVDKLFYYKVPKNLEKDIRIGIRVKVPFANKKLEGFVLEITNKKIDMDLKEVIAIVDNEIVLTEELIKLGKEMKELTLASLISCYQAMLPKALKAKNNTLINKKYDVYYRLNKKAEKLNSKQQEIISLFKEKELVPRQEIINISLSSLNTLVKKGILTKVEKEHYRLEHNNEKVQKHPLTAEQKEVVKKVDMDSFNTYLLYGVTGSGKTEVYMELIEKALEKGKRALVLVPEISLTEQMIDRFEKRFGTSIATLHSSLSEGEKYDEYRRISKGEADVVIGARSAVFAPISNLGIVVIDEEHSESYKQDSTPRYNAIDIAKIRAKDNNIPLILGSATPLLESFARANKNVYKLLTLKNRINTTLPAIEIVDLNKEIKYMQGHFSSTLIEKMKEKLARGEQVILLLNRRGYSSFVTCQNCGEVIKCPHCDITLTYHKTSHNLRCHYCGYATKFYDKCPNCQEHALKDLGVGTQKIEEELKNLFPDNKVIRMDFDTTSRKGMHEKIINTFKNHEADILLGTQVVAKGLDFPNVTLVGVINADTSLNIPDFRSSENTFSLLLQVAGRSGRRSKGEVVIQTYNPDHYAIKLLNEHNYEKFYQQEMMIRRNLKYPPYYYLVHIRVSSKKEDLLSLETKKIIGALKRNLKETIILGPSISNPYKLNNNFRLSIILKYKYEERLNDTLNKLIDHYKGNNNIKIDIDFNPRHF